MFRILLTILLIWGLGYPLTARAFLGFGKTYLVKINDKVYTPEDFKKWWNFWRDDNTPFPESPEPFIEWNLLADEAEAMDLQDSPSYRRKLEVFLKVRALLLLRNEEVDQKIKVTREDLWALYQREFVPRVKLRVLFSRDGSQVKAWLKEAREKGCDEVFKKVSEKNKKDMGFRRPRQISPSLRPEVVKASPGDVLGPFHERGRYLIICVLDKVGPTPGDFEALIPNLGEILRRKEEARLTAELIERLKKKYGVKVDWELARKVGVEGELPEELRDKPVVTIGEMKLTAERFQRFLRRDMRIRYPGKKKLSDRELDKLRKTVIANVLAQTLTELEALNRHYERREPLKSLWEFYKRQMLVREFERQVIWPRVKVTDEEVREYYEKHKKDYLRPAKVVIAVIRSQDEKLMREVYRRLRSGEDFFEVAKAVHFHGVHPERYRVDQLKPEMKEVLASLEPGEVSGLFKIGNFYVLVKLIERIAPSPHPFEMVKESIREMLKRQKFEKLRREYVERLKARSRIQVNEKAWHRLVKELAA